MAQWPGNGQVPSRILWPARKPGTGAGTESGTEAGTGETVPIAAAGTAVLSVPAADDTPLPLGERLAAWYSELPGWAQDLLWPFIRLALDVYNGRPDSMADYHRYIRSREWVHPMLDGWGRKFSAGAGITYHVLIGQWLTALGSLIAYCGPRPLRFLGLVLSIIGFAVFARLI